ncbi:hypothetical protein BZA05DRAFT_384649 [Tricharina praecox]|uniref:uncharacterized protein n=1 Tax=Tricharina praecox TaxID=43433 RepID=UPI00221EC78D|nr:uncharacterized protein BZA05DRAFT_384649 [Tricharina praecox]KAI5857737.1 hypothetical protein BZA05DRAFT_384649 [Tricharina praecox]
MFHQNSARSLSHAYPIFSISTLCLALAVRSTNQHNPQGALNTSKTSCTVLSPVACLTTHVLLVLVVNPNPPASTSITTPSAVSRTSAIAVAVMWNSPKNTGMRFVSVHMSGADEDRVNPLMSGFMPNTCGGCCRKLRMCDEVSGSVIDVVKDAPVGDRCCVAVARGRGTIVYVVSDGELLGACCLLLVAGVRGAC